VAKHKPTQPGRRADANRTVTTQSRRADANLCTVDAAEAISDAFSGFFSAPAPPPIDVQEPSASIVAAGKAMPALGPVFNAEADLQAALTNLGSYDVDEVQGDIEATINSAPVVIYTYGLSPFSTEAVSVLESTGCKHATPGSKRHMQSLHLRSRPRSPRARCTVHPGWRTSSSA
jgi:hypothetical protein